MHFSLDWWDLILIYSQTSLHFWGKYQKPLGGYLLPKWSKMAIKIRLDKKVNRNSILTPKFLIFYKGCGILGNQYHSCIMNTDLLNPDWDLQCGFTHGPHEYTVLSDEISGSFTTVSFSEEKNLTWGTWSYPLLKNYQIRKYRVCNNLIINFCLSVVIYVIYSTYINFP